MQKVSNLIIAIVIIVSLMCAACSSCAVNQYSVYESQSNFEEYAKRLADIANSYNLQLYEVESSFVEDSDNKSVEAKFEITVDEGSYIEIFFSNSTGKRGKNNECFSVSYVKSQQSNSFNIDLFVSLINSISYRTISSDSCRDFLAAPEEKYAPASYRKLNGEKKVKYYHLDFFENWSLWYFLKDNDSEELSFNGLTN